MHFTFMPFRNKHIDGVEEDGLYLEGYWKEGACNFLKFQFHHTKTLRVQLL